jgi:multicomponent Na+:H+ antiporter subunit E
VSLNPRYLVTPVALAALWWLLTRSEPGAWLVGVPAVIAAGWAAWSLGAGGHSPISLSGLLRLLPLFIWESLRGGIDVARRTLAPNMRIRPGFIQYRTSLEHSSARVFFTNCVCLLPGTLAADLQDDRIRIHLLDSTLDPQAELERLEIAVARVYRERTLAPGAPS